MKKALPIMLFAASCFSGSAAPLTKTTSLADQLHRAAYNAILQHQTQSSAAHKTTAGKMRVVANSYVTNNQLRDSNHYYYSNGRGSANTDADSYYDNFYITAIDPKQTIFSDSSVNWFFGSAGLTRSGVRSYTYDANNRVTQLISQFIYYTSVSKPVYNSAGQIIEIIGSDTSGGGVSFIPKSHMYITYDGSGRKIFDSSFNLVTNKPQGKRIYTYDANGNRTLFESYEYDTSGAMFLTYRNTNTYDGANRLLTTISELDLFGTGLEKSNKDSFAYQGTSKQPYYHLDLQWDDINLEWRNNEITYNFYNPQGLLDNYIIVQYTGTWDTIERNVHTYNADNLLLKTNGYMYQGGGTFNPLPYDQSTQYYEEYYPVAINEAVKENSVIVYPNPASSIIHVQASNATGSVLIYNNAGLVMHQSAEQKLDNIILDVSTYPAGNYFISVSAQDGTTIHTTRFTKL